MNTRHARLLCAFALAGLAFRASAAPAVDLPASSACHTALQILADAEDALMTAPVASAPDLERQRTVTARLLPLRQRVADACLGGMTTSPPPSQHTGVVPALPRTAPLAPRASVPAGPVGSEPLLRWQPPVTVTHCTGAICTASDGSTLTRVGPGLMGPRGACTLQGSFLRCP